VECGLDKTESDWETEKKLIVALKTQGKQLSLSSSNSQTVPPLNAYIKIQ